MAALGSLHGRMRAYEIGDQSSDLTLHMVERPIPTPGPGQVLIKVNATGLNARDLWLVRQKNKPHHIPFSDNAGHVAALGPGVKDFEIGDRIIVNHYFLFVEGDWRYEYNFQDHGSSVDGFLAEYAIANANALVKCSDRLPDVELAAISTAGLTAWRSLGVEARPKPSEIVLTLGTGGVSVFNIQVAKFFGCRVIVTSSSDEKLERMKTIGADMTVNYRSTRDWAAKVMELTAGRGVDIILNTVGYPELENCFRCAGNNARCIHIGASRQQVEIKPLQNFFMKDCSIKGIAQGSRRALAECVRAMDVNGLRPLVDKVFTFEDAVDAFRLMETTDRVGKVMIKVADR